MQSYIVHVQSGPGKGGRWFVEADTLEQAREKAQKRIKKLYGSRARKILVRKETKYT